MTRTNRSPSQTVLLLSFVLANLSSGLSVRLSLCPAVFCLHRRPGHGDLRRVPAAELGAEAGRAAGDDRRLLAADGGLLHLAVCPLRHRPPQHRVRGCLFVFFSEC